MAIDDSSSETADPLMDMSISSSTSGVANLDLGKPLNCMSVAAMHHPGASLIAAVGGAQMLKLVNITPHGLIEKKNLRLTTKVTSEVNFSIMDVEWCQKDATRNVLASAASNGNITIWDSSRDGRSSQERVIPAHPRTVNRINWHPQEEGILLSASQDTTIKLWDRRGRSYNCQMTFTPRSESVRDVQWNPSQIHLFAAACENGSVHLYDRRKSAAPLLRIMGHNGLVLALEWHLTEPFMLATGARDRTVKIWDLSDQTRDDNMKETYLINTVSAVNRIKWRPGYPEQLSTTSSVQGDNMIHLWNIRHPYLPLATMDGHEDVCGSFAWLDTPCRPHLGGGERGVGSGELGTSPLRGGTTVAASRTATSSSSSSSSTKLWSKWGGMTWDSSGTSGVDSNEKDLEEYTDYLGVWQHLVSCGRDGRVIFHSLARASRPRDTLTPSVVALSPRGDLFACHEKIDRSRDFVGIVLDERTGNAPGLFADSPSPPSVEGVVGGTALTTAAAPPMLSTVTRSRSLSGSDHLLDAGGSGGVEDSGKWNPPPLELNRSSSARLHQPVSNVNTLIGGTATTTSPTTQAPQQQTIGGETGTRRSNSGSNILMDGSGQGGGGGLMTFSPLDKPAPHWLPRFLYEFPWDEEAWPILMSPYQEEGPTDMVYHHDQGTTGFPLRSAEQIACLAKDYILRPFGPEEALSSAAASAQWSYIHCHMAREDFCRHNAEVARRAGQGRTAHMWEVLALFLPQQLGGEEGFSASTYGGGKEEGEGGGQQQQQSSSATLQMLRQGLLTSVVEELLDQGDVQNCVALFEVIESTGRDLEGEQLKDLIDVSKERIRECYLGYIELLHRLELFQAANELVAGVTDKFIQQLHVTNTTTYASCASCRRPMSTVDTATGNTTASPWCAKCKSIVSQCAVCLQPVRGIYVWCPGCSHGGHVDHMREWFLNRRNAVCPTGCGHVCHFISLDPAASAASGGGVCK